MYSYVTSCIAILRNRGAAILPQVFIFVYLLLGCDRPLLKDLYKHVVPLVADKWRDIGVHLLHPTIIDDRVLEVIAADHPHSVEGCCKSMFEKWLETQKDANWNKLLEAIKKIKLHYIADKLEKYLQGKKYIRSYYA